MQQQAAAAATEAFRKTLAGPDKAAKKKAKEKLGKSSSLPNITNPSAAQKASTVKPARAKKRGAGNGKFPHIVTVSVGGLKVSVDGDCTMEYQNGNLVIIPAEGKSKQKW